MGEYHTIDRAAAVEVNPRCTCTANHHEWVLAT